MKSYKIRLISILTIIFFCLSSLPALAVPLKGYKLPSTTSYYYYDNYLSSNSQIAAGSGTSSWNSTSSKVKYYFSSSSYITYVTETYNSNVGWDGLTNTIYDSSTGIVISETVTVNTAKTDTYTNSTALKSVLAHEFGHVLGLADDGTNPTLMNGYTWGTYSRYGYYGISSPTSNDVSSANSIY